MRLNYAPLIMLIMSVLWLPEADELVIEVPQRAGISGFRAHWDAPIPLVDGGARSLVDTQVKERDQTTVHLGRRREMADPLGRTASRPGRRRSPS